MPRIANIYSIPPGTEGFPDQTIESEKYNNYIHDVETDLNLPRPISAGGTGADDADEALANLHAEKASQEITNYGSDVLVPGSFFSRTTATDPPVVGHAFSGIIHGSNDANMVMHAVDLSDPFKAVWTRVKYAGAWDYWIKGSSYASLICADTPPAGMPDNSLWFESDTGLLYVRYNDGDSTQWTIACPQPDISSYLLKSGDTMTGPLILPVDAPALALQAVNKDYVDSKAVASASAYDALHINGAFNISQEVGGAARNTTGYICDGWVLTKSLTGSGAVAFQTSSAAGFVYGITGALVGTVVTAQATIGSADVVSVTTRIEGYRAVRLCWGTPNAKPITIGFWSAHAPAGLYSVCVKNAADTRVYVATYTQATANVPQYNVVTIPGSTDSGWDVTSSIGLVIIFTMAAGSSRQTASVNQWMLGNIQAAAEQVNGLADIASSFKLTGVFVLPGTAVPSADRSALVMRPYDQELALCQRYFQKIIVPDATAVSMGMAQGFSVAWFMLRYPAVRTQPIISFSALSDFAVLDPGFIPTVTALNPTNVGLTSARLEVTAAAGTLTTNHIVLLQGRTANAAILIDARL